MGKAKTTGGLIKSDLVKNKNGNCEQEELGTWQEGLRSHQRLDFCSPEGKEGTWFEGLRRYQEGLSSLPEGQGVLQVSFSAWLQLRLWGYLHPSSAVASDCVSFVEHHC